MLSPNLSDKVVLDSTFQSLSKDMLHGRVLKNSSHGLPCPHFFHGNGIFPILSNIDLFAISGQFCGFEAEGHY